MHWNNEPQKPSPPCELPQVCLHSGGGLITRPISALASSFPCSHFLGLSVSHSYVRIFFNANSFLSFSNYSPNAMGPTSEMKFKPYLSLRWSTFSQSSVLPWILTDSSQDPYWTPWLCFSTFQFSFLGAISSTTLIGSRHCQAQTPCDFLSPNS